MKHVHSVYSLKGNSTWWLKFISTHTKTHSIYSHTRTRITHTHTRAHTSPSKLVVPLTYVSVTYWFKGRWRINRIELHRMKGLINTEPWKILDKPDFESLIGLLVLHSSWRVFFHDIFIYRENNKIRRRKPISKTVVWHFQSLCQRLLDKMKEKKKKKDKRL